MFDDARGMVSAVPAEYRRVYLKLPEGQRAMSRFVGFQSWPNLCHSFVRRHQELCRRWSRVVLGAIFPQVILGNLFDLVRPETAQVDKALPPSSGMRSKDRSGKIEVSIS